MRQPILYTFLSLLTGYFLFTEYGFVLPILGIAFAITLILLKRPADNFILSAIFIYPLLPFLYGFDLGYPFPVIKIHRILLLLIFAVWIGNKGIINIWNAFSKFPISKISITVVSILLLVCIMNGASFAGYNYVVSFAIERILFAFFVFDFFKLESDQIKLMKIICLSGVVIALFGIVERQIGFNWYSLLPAYRDELSGGLEQLLRYDQARVKGAFTHAISYGATLSIILAIMISLFLQEKNRIYIVSALLLLVGCYLSISRGPLVMFVFILVLMLTFRARKWLSILIIVATIFVYQPLIEIKAINKAIELIDDSINTKSTEVGDSSYARLNQYALAQKYIVSSPLVGYGYVRFNNELDETVDNYYLKYVLNFGIVGMTVLLFLIFNIFGKAMHIFRHGKTLFQTNFALAIIATTLGILLLWFSVALEEYLFYYWVMSGVIMRMYVDNISSVKTEEGQCLPVL